MSSDPRVSKSRQPKAYTADQLDFLKSYLPEYEKRSQGSIRGDSKKFAFQKATEYIERFGMSPEFMTVEDGEMRFKEQIYNWFKNTVGRNRRKAEGRTRPTSSKKANVGDEKGSAQPAASGSGLSSSGSIPWNPVTTASPTVTPYPGHLQDQDGGGSGHGKGASAGELAVTTGASGQVLSPMQYHGGSPMHSLGPSLPASTHQHSNTSSSSTPNTHPSHTHSIPNHSLPPQQSSLQPARNVMSLREAFMRLDAANLANVIQTFVANSLPSPTPLTPVVEALFEASIAEPPAYSRDVTPLVRRYLEASSYFPPTIMHAGFSGQLAASRALQMQIRRNSVWISTSPSFTSISSTSTSTYSFPPTGGSSVGVQQNYYLHPHGTGGSAVSPMASTPTAVSTTLSEDMQRIATERQRRKDHIQWAKIHAAALELGMMNQVHIAGSRRGSLGAASSLNEGVNGLGQGEQQHGSHGHHASGHDHTSGLAALSHSHGGLAHGLGQHHGISSSSRDAYEYAAGRAFSETVARDAGWETDEAEWVAGIFVLRALIRTAVRGDRRQRDEYSDMLRLYEGRWKEIKDEVRQTMVTEVLLSAKEDLSRLESESLA